MSEKPISVRDALTEVIERKGPSYPAVNGPALIIRVPYTLTGAARDRIAELETKLAMLQVMHAHERELRETNGPCHARCRDRIEELERLAERGRRLLDE